MLLLAATGCQGISDRAAHKKKDGGLSVDGSEQDVDHGTIVNVRLWVIESWIDTGPITSFAHLTQPQRRLLTTLASMGKESWTVHAMNGRILLRLPDKHPAGGLDLLLAEDQNQLVIFHPKKKQRFTLPLERLPDLLDGNEASGRSDFTNTTHLQTQRARSRSAPRSDRKVKTRTHLSTLSLSYRPEADRPLSWPIRLQLQLVVPDDPPRWPYQEPLLHLALPLLVTERGVLALESLATTTGSPTSWSLNVTNEGRPSSCPPTIHGRVLDYGFIRVPLASISLNRKKYNAGRRLFRRSEPGMQLIPPADLKALRSSQPAGPLEVNNRSRFTAQVYVDGIRLGWVGPKKKFSFSGLPAGYFRVYCVSPTAIRSWGPYDIYVPGPITLR